MSSVTAAVSRSGPSPLVDRHVLQPGAHLPVADFPLADREELDALGLLPTTRPASRNLAAGETAHVRRYSSKPNAPAMLLAASTPARSSLIVMTVTATSSGNDAVSRVGRSLGQ